MKKNKTTDVDFTKVKPYNQDEEKTAQLARMFNTISDKYDKFNDIMSWGMARVWRKQSLLSLKQYKPLQILDIAAGTADMCIKAYQYLKPEHVTGVDISDRMLEMGRVKIAQANLSEIIDLQVQDCSTLTFADETFDAATIAFGIRNFEKLNESLQQIHRVLKPNGHLLILEMNEPQRGLLLKGYQLYTRIFVRMTAKYLSSDKVAYDYLTASMHAFPNGERLINILTENGFRLNIHRKFTFGVCSMYLVQKVKS
ncbi:MAG: bifunctional demethylmenaquinone methyltransferase/2-methoxy-6-polyprenyl-1,4-benzoquinol methylase UbiE [Paludibacter sp.]|jgi:demethylmenaquinone methyltransferase/2-methoxy-6-polyprenyl-1,4-benzoquinol methylase|nr:bifunctional demethylmenaquinone methyltransferase/2-methoxy-6-polyprenyl-1,4-benzoquinol methylase UbiE [Paludibacter sp.]MBP7611680.1 bifunctional demethylmenaquinone methyltransferase/2-methoxy-6-polyprenyl-1,4-benzoquinol methylase UbiE [Paludibacter sp.]